MSLSIYLIRHGETEWSLSRQYSGRKDIPLTPQGEAQARALRTRLQGIRFTQVLSSPLHRAQQTCEFAGLGNQLEIERDLIEWNNGDDEGRTLKDIHKERPGWNIFTDGSPNGESPEQIKIRADNLIQRLSLLEGTIALFSHGHFGRSLIARWINLPIQHAQSFIIDPASVSILSYEHDVRENPAVKLLNSFGN